MEEGTRDSESANLGRSDEPLYVAAARRLKPEGEELEAFLARNTEAISHSRFPAPGCLHPDELSAYRSSGYLPEERRQHLLSCPACSAMVEATQPSEERVRAFREAVAAARGGVEREPAFTATAPGVVLATRKPVRSWRWAAGFAFAAMVAVLLGTTILWRQRAPDIVHHESAAVVTPQVPVSREGRVVVTAQLTAPQQINRPFVRTAPITVTASTKDAATTAAATAAVLTHLHSIEMAAYRFTRPSLSSTCEQQVVTYYAGLLSDYLKEKGDAKDVATWFAQYKKAHPEEAGALEVALKNDRACNPDSSHRTSLTSVSVPVVPTLKAASAYYVDGAAKLNKTEIGNEDLSLTPMKYPDVTLKVQVEAPESARPSRTLKSVGSASNVPAEAASH